MQACGRQRGLGTALEVDGDATVMTQVLVSVECRKVSPIHLCSEGTMRMHTTQNRRQQAAGFIYRPLARGMRPGVVSQGHRPTVEARLWQPQCQRSCSGPDPRSGPRTSQSRLLAPSLLSEP